MKLIVFALISFVLGFAASELGPREVVITHPVVNPKTQLHGVMIKTQSRFNPFYQRETTAMIGPEDWLRFCPLDHETLFAVVDSGDNTVGGGHE